VGCSTAVSAATVPLGSLACGCSLVLGLLVHKANRVQKLIGIAVQTQRKSAMLVSKTCSTVDLLGATVCAGLLLTTTATAGARHHHPLLQLV
jgi:hypothetical protein